MGTAAAAAALLRVCARVCFLRGGLSSLSHSTQPHQHTARPPPGCAAQLYIMPAQKHACASFCAVQSGGAPSAKKTALATLFQRGALQLAHHKTDTHTRTPTLETRCNAVPRSRARCRPPLLACFRAAAFGGGVSVSNTLSAQRRRRLCPYSRSLSYYFLTC